MNAVQRCPVTTVKDASPRKPFRAMSVLNFHTRQLLSPTSTQLSSLRLPDMIEVIDVLPCKPVKEREDFGNVNN